MSPKGRVIRPEKRGFADVDVFAEAVALWPNPSQGRFRLKVDGLPEDLLRVRIRDLYGRELLIREFRGRWVDTEFDLSPQAAGIYFLELENGGRREVLRLVKE